MCRLYQRKDKLLKSEIYMREIQPLTLFKMCLWLVWECIKVAKVFMALIFDFIYSLRWKILIRN